MDGKPKEKIKKRQGCVGCMGVRERLGGQLPRGCPQPATRSRGLQTSQKITHGFMEATEHRVAPYFGYLPGWSPFPSLYSRTWRSEAALHARVIFGRPHSQRHPFGSQSKRTPNGPDLSLHGPMLGPRVQRSRGWKEGRKGFACIRLAACPRLGLGFI